jgi:hypothetical protein
MQHISIVWQACTCCGAAQRIIAGSSASWAVQQQHMLVAGMTAVSNFTAQNCLRAMYVSLIETDGNSRRTHTQQ